MFTFEVALGRPRHILERLWAAEVVQLRVSTPCARRFLLMHAPLVSASFESRTLLSACLG